MPPRQETVLSRLRRDEVSCCEFTSDICGPMSATISHISSEEAEVGGAEAWAPCAHWCLFRRRHFVGFSV